MKNGNRYCPFCGRKLQKGGHDKYGKQRGRCVSCNKIVRPARKLKKIQKERLWVSRYLKYITNTKKHAEYDGNRVTFGRNTKFIKDKNIFIPNDREPKKILHFDGKYVHHRCYLIASDGEHVVGYSLVKQEDRTTGRNFISCFPKPEYVVCDGERGLTSAINDIWPTVKIQRCLFHVWMNIRQKLTLTPETEAGIELLILGKRLLKIRNIEQKEIWLKDFKTGKEKYEEFVKEKTGDPTTGEVGFKHKKLRSAAYNLSLLILKNNLFWYLEDQHVPKTNNCLEGGINSPLTFLLNSHRGTNFIGQQKIIEIYLLKRSKYGKLLSRILNIKNH